VRLILYVVLAVAAGLLAFVIALTFKDPAETLNRLADLGGYQRETDIAYGDHPRQKLDLYRPAQSSPSPVVVFFYGGAWSSGDKADARFIGAFLASRGFTVVIPDYRIRPEVAFPVFLEDGARALRWVEDHVAAHGGDPDRVFLMGHSAGAYNAVMLALDRRYAANAGFDAARLRGVVALAGPYDFELDTDLRRWVFGAAADFAATQPVNFAAAGAPPMLLVTGTADETVDPENSRSLARRLEAAGSPVTLREVEGFRHMGVLLKLSLWYPGSDLREEIVAFLRENVR